MSEAIDSAQNGQENCPSPPSGVGDGVYEGDLLVFGIEYSVLFCCGSGLFRLCFVLGVVFCVCVGF
jgi:hypothetical protein